jgi:hypothetical protein
MTIAKGTAKQVGYKKESSFGTLAGTSAGKLLRRVTASFNLTKETYESGEIRTDRQIADFRHGVRSAEGSLNGELAPASYADFMGSVLARDFTTAPAATGVSITIDASGALYTITRGAGNWLTEGFKVGQVIRLSGANLDTDNVGNNLLVTLVADTVLTVKVVNGSALVEEGPAASSNITAVGKVTFVPATGHTDQSYTIEEWYSDIAQSEVYTGMKVNSLAVQLPATGLTTIDVAFAGKDMASTGTIQYFSSPTAQGTDGIFAAVNGVMLVDGAPVALVTSADFTVERATENATTVGSNSVADIFTGRIRVTGNLSVYFQDDAFRTYFDAETPVSLVLVLTSDSSNDSDFVTFTLPKVKLGSFTKDDGELGVVAATSFQALLNEVTTAGLPATTIAVQDSAI